MTNQTMMLPGKRTSVVIMAEIEVTRYSDLANVSFESLRHAIKDGVAMVLLQLVGTGQVVINDVLITPPLPPLDGSDLK